MGIVMIKCPVTGREIWTGIKLGSPVFFAYTWCPICKTDHQWFAGDAWVSESSAGTGKKAA
jgi:hypothetical protein